MSAGSSVISCIACNFIGATVKLLIDEQKVLNALYFQDDCMKNVYRRFPEIIFVDSTHKTNNLGMPLYLIVVEDGNGESEIVAVWMVLQETGFIFDQLLTIFKEENARWNDTKVVMTDKDFIERDSFSRLLSQATLHICLYHVLRSFRREITTEKMNINAAQRVDSLKLLQQLAYSKNREEYDATLTSLSDLNFVKVTDYYMQNWHAIRNEWVDFARNETVNFGNRTNNRIESMNQKIKQVLTSNSNFVDFVQGLLVLLRSFAVERDSAAAKLLIKVAVSFYNVNTFE